jgi:membrane-associated protease RseP (regulator of RpoE activity)
VRRRLSGLLFLATLLTTTMAGSWLAGADSFADPLGLIGGLPFSVSLMSILGVHELAHYFASRRHGVKATWPLFIPAPIPPVGTFGAIIRLRSVIPDRRALLEIGAAGPLAGFAAAVPLAVVGIALSRIEIPQVHEGGSGIALGGSLVFLLLEKAVFGSLPDGAHLFLHPVAFAAWFGFFVTAMNLLPIGQLDGGHVLYALFGRRHRGIATLFLILLIPLSILWPGWLFWGALMCLIGFRHPPVFREGRPLARRQKLLALLALLVLVLTFTPAPFTI